MPGKKTFAEFFAGIGLVRAGLEPLGWQCVYANDIDAKKAAMYGAHFGDPEHYHIGDVWQTNEVASRLGESPVLATASFPCTDMSLAGQMKGFQGGESSAFFGFCEALAALPSPPKLVLLENVPGFLSSHQGQDFQTAAESLAELGYSLDAFILDAKNFTPQSRPRLFLLGFAEAMISSQFVRKKQSTPEQWQSALDLSPQIRSARLITAMQGASLKTDWVTRLRTEPTPHACSLQQVIDVDTAQPWWESSQVQRHYAMMNDSHRERVDQRVDAGKPFAATAFRRIRQGVQRLEVRFDGVAGCLRTPRGGSARQIVVAGVQGQLKMRWMTPREYARLQGADQFVIETSPNQALFGFGDAVCVPVIRWIDENILTPTWDEYRKDLSQ